MPAITLPDGSQRHFDNPVSVADVAADIGAGLAKATLAGVVDGEVVDASFVMDQDATLAIVTDRSDEALDIIRHSSAHLLAMAVKQLFPSAQVTIGIQCLSQRRFSAIPILVGAYPFFRACGQTVNNFIKAKVIIDLMQEVNKGSHL